MSIISHNEAVQDAAILVKALPYLRQYAGSIVVIKYGGHAMQDMSLARTFGRDIALLRQVGIYPVVVHGGGPHISATLKKMGVESEFIDGLRVTTEEIVSITEMVLSGLVNKDVTSLICSAGGLAVGISGKDGHLITAEKLPLQNHKKDLGYVGYPSVIYPQVIESFIEAEIIPVIAPIGADKQGVTYNINADMVAGAIASALHAKRLIMLTDVPGVMDRHGKVLSQLSLDDVTRMIKEKEVTGGMIPKIRECVGAVKHGVEGAAIVDGRTPHATLLELFIDTGYGTLIHADAR